MQLEVSYEPECRYSPVTCRPDPLRHCRIARAMFIEAAQLKETSCGDERPVIGCIQVPWDKLESASVASHVTLEESGPAGPDM